MKRFIFILIFTILCLLGWKYYGYMNKPNQTQVDSVVEPYLNEWKAEMTSNGIVYDEALNRVVEIKLSAGLESSGEYDLSTRTILINSLYARESEWYIRAILWHELGHAVFGYEHSNSGIMYPNLLKEEDYINNWEDYKTEYINGNTR